MESRRGPFFRGSSRKHQESPSTTWKFEMYTQTDVFETLTSLGIYVKYGRKIILLAFMPHLHANP